MQKRAKKGDSPLCPKAASVIRENWKPSAPGGQSGLSPFFAPILRHFSRALRLKLPGFWFCCEPLLTQQRAKKGDSPLCPKAASVIRESWKPSAPGGQSGLSPFFAPSTKSINPHKFNILAFPGVILALFFLVRSTVFSDLPTNNARWGVILTPGILKTPPEELVN